MVILLKKYLVTGYIAIKKVDDGISYHFPVYVLSQITYNVRKLCHAISVQSVFGIHNSSMG